jgi:hypothetical protein
MPIDAAPVAGDPVKDTPELPYAIPVVSAAARRLSVPAVPEVKFWAAVEVATFALLDSATVAVAVGADVKVTVTVSEAAIATVVVHEILA